MYVIAIHAVSDPEKFWGAAQDMQLPQGTADGGLGRRG